MQVRDPAVIMFSAAGTIIGWDRGAELLLGYEAREVLGEPSSLIMPDRPPVEQQVATLSCRAKDGSLLPVVARRSLITDGADRLLAVTDVLTLTGDVALQRALREAPREQGEDRERALRERLQEEQERLRSIMATVPGVVITYRVRADGSTELSFVSAAAQELYGFSPAELRSDTSLMVSRLHPADVQAAAPAIEQSMRSGMPWRGEFRYEHPTKGERWIESHMMPVRAHDGILSWSGVTLDITDRKHAEEQLRLAKTLLDSALSAARMGAWAIDLEQSKVWGNESQRRLWEVPAEASLWYDVAFARAKLHPDDRALVDREMERAFETGEASEFEFRLILSDGSVRWIASRAQTEQRLDGRPGRVVGINMDVTNQKLAAEAALRAQKLEGLGTLAGGIAHDFNNVLFAIAGNTALALSSLEPSSPVRPFLEQVTLASTRASELVKQILAFSRPEDQKREVLDLAGPVREALGLVRATIPAMIALEADLDPDTPPIMGDASRLVQVVVNLCTNAVHAIGKGRSGRIDVELRPCLVDTQIESEAVRLSRGTYAMLSVRDDGCGMNDATRARIFDPFFTTKQPGEGTGLGLAVVHGIVEALGGAITVHSQVGEGSTFRLYFPTTVQPAAASAPEVKPRPRAAGQRILFVEDEAMLVQLGVSMLRVLGYGVEAFQSAKAALEAFERAPEAFAAAITDLAMPDMSGFELARALLARRADLPILMMSGYVGPDERTDATEIGIRELLLKPVSLDQLAEALARLC